MVYVVLGPEQLLSYKNLEKWGPSRFECADSCVVHMLLPTILIDVCCQTRLRSRLPQIAQYRRNLPSATTFLEAKWHCYVACAQPQQINGQAGDAG